MQKKKRFKKIILLGSILIIILIMTKVINIEEYRNFILVKMYGTPIAVETGTINNDYFHIKSNGTDAKATTEGISKAIEYAAKHNIESIQLEKGTYLINGTKYEKWGRGISLKSNITLNLNGSQIKHETNQQPGYTIFNVENVENVKILNGILMGDKDEHDYDTITSKHEWGMGIQILGSDNVEIGNLEIQNMTGDGIYISEANDIKSTNIMVYNNHIYNCRRQGISVIVADNIVIRDNEIHTIRGCGIDFERNFDNQTCHNVQIFKNKFYDINNPPKYAIFIHDGITEMKIFENELYNSKIQISYPNQTIKVYDNRIK